MEYSIRKGREHVDLDTVHPFLTRSYWAEGRTRDEVARTVEHSLCWSLFHGDRQVGFARIVTDYVTFAYLGDVFILPEHRGRGLALKLVREILADPTLADVKRWRLATQDAHALYAKLGFRACPNPERQMELDR